VWHRLSFSNPLHLGALSAIRPMICNAAEVPAATESTRKPFLSSSFAMAVASGGSPEIRLFSLSRNVLAEFLSHQLEDRSWIRKSPAILNRS
jgi:hypothetical protein